MRRAIMETAKRDAAPIPDSPLSPDVLETARTAAQAAGESLEAFLSRAVRAQAVRDETERANAAKASERPRKEAVFPSAVQNRNAAPFMTDNPAIIDNVSDFCALLNQGERKANHKGRSKVSQSAVMYLEDALKAGYTPDEIKAALEKGAQEGYAGGWRGLPDYCRKLYGRRYPKK